MKIQADQRIKNLLNIKQNLPIGEDMNAFVYPRPEGVCLPMNICIRLIIGLVVK